MKNKILIVVIFITLVGAGYSIYSYSRFTYNQKQLKEWCPQMGTGGGSPNNYELCKNNWDKTYWKVFKQPFIETYQKYHRSRYQYIQ